MANRVIEAKIRKMKASKRKAYLKHRPSIGPNTTVLREYIARNKPPAVVERILRYVEKELGPDRIRVPEHRKLDQAMVERYKGIEPKFVMPERGYQIPELRDPAPPRVRVIQQLQKKEPLRVMEIFALWQGQRHQGYAQWNCVVLFRHEDVVDYMLFSGQKYFIVREDYVNKLLKFSAVFSERERLLARYRDFAIRWVEESSLYASQEDMANLTQP